MTIASFNSIDKATRVVKLFFLEIFQLFMGLQHCFTQRTAKDRSRPQITQVSTTINYHQLLLTNIDYHILTIRGSWQLIPTCSSPRHRHYVSLVTKYPRLSLSSCTQIKSHKEKTFNIFPNNQNRICKVFIEIAANLHLEIKKYLMTCFRVNDVRLKTKFKLPLNVKKLQKALHQFSKLFFLFTMSN